MRSLLATLLVVRTRSGPQLVYRYPPYAQRLSVKPDEEDEHSCSDSDSDEDINGIASLRRTHQVKPSQESAQTTVNAAEALPETDEFLGFSEDSLEKLLAPGHWSDRKRFQVCIDGLTFVGHPIHAHEDGRWTRKEIKPPHGVDHALPEPDDRYGDYTNFGFTVTEPLSPVRTTRDFPHVPDSLESRLGRSLGTSMNSASSTSTTRAEQLSMFNVVFVFDTSGETEGGKVVEDAYRHVVRKLSKALHYCQKQSGDVGVETKRLLSLYARAKQDHLSAAALQQQMAEVSELAWALKEVFDRLSAGEIAGIRLNGQAISLHVPPPQAGTHTPTTLEPTAGLLLLEDKGALLRELSHPDASPLAHFLREHTPTKPLQKLAARIGMSIDEVLYLAHHLVKWRKARAVLPLHPRNTYVVPPTAPTDRIAEFADEYARRFPGLPSLPQMLKFLSTGKPIKYGILMPSRDHRAPYMEILAYLVRHGFVVQLRTFGWVRRVGRRVGRREREVVDRNRVPLSVASLLSPQLRAVGDDDVVSVSSERTAIPVPLAARVKPAPAKSSRRLSHGDDNSEYGEKTEAEDPWDVILDPTDASDEDNQALENVRDAIEDEELRIHFPNILGYFNGEEALEGIAAREGMKRSVVERWLDLLQREGLVTTVRHS